MPDDSPGKDEAGAGEGAELVDPSNSRKAMPTIQFGLAFNPKTTAAEQIAAKLGPEDISKLVSQGGIDEANRHAESMETLRGTKQIVLALIAGDVAISIAIVCSSKPEMLKHVITILITAGGGFGAGRLTAPKAPSRSKPRSG